jgi:DNA invertase Pin-like site-specific DNA recombinase
MKIALYARVSKTLEQNPENQLIALREWAKRSEHEVVGEFIDEISSRDTRPQKEMVLRMLRLGEVQGVAFWSLDRWGRSMSELVLELEEFSKTGKALISLKEGLDLTNAAGRMFANILAAMANYERDRIQERTLLGLARARAQGKILGRPRKTPPANPEQLLEVELSNLKNARFLSSSDTHAEHLKIKKMRKDCKTTQP